VDSWRQAGKLVHLGLGLLLAAGCGGVSSPAASSASPPTPTPTPSPVVQFPISGLVKMTITADSECGFPSSRREREFVLSIPSTSSTPDVYPAFVDARVVYGGGTILGGGYRPMLTLRYTPPTVVAGLDFGELVGNEFMIFYGTVAFSPSLPSCARLDGYMYLDNGLQTYTCGNQWNPTARPNAAVCFSRAE
jgi:hypothetical protein